MSPLPQRMSTTTRFRDMETRPVSTEDISLAFSFLSTDGKKVTREDVRHAVETCFPTLNPKLVKLVTSGKEDVTKEGLTMMLINRGLGLDYFDESFQFFEPQESGFIPTATYKKLLRNINRHGLPHKGDIAAIKARFDRDHDGEINLEDFKLMNKRFTN